MADGSLNPGNKKMETRVPALQTLLRKGEHQQDDMAVDDSATTKTTVVDGDVVNLQGSIAEMRA